jgi:hypothetical protein
MTMAWGFGIALAAVAFAAETPPAAMKVTDVTVFKDGHALVMARGSATLADGWCRTREVPAPILGTFWAFTTDADAKVDIVKAGFVESNETLPCLTLDQIIQANKGKEAVIIEQPKDAPAVAHTGILRGIVEHEEERETPVARSTPNRYDRWGRYIGEGNVTEAREERVRSFGSFVMIETKDGVELILRDAIRSISLAGKNPATTRTETKKVREIAMHVVAKGRPASGKQEVGAVYLQKGLRWIPCYRIELLDDGKAKLCLQGTLINELTDLENANVRLVVGVPSFVMKDTLSPLALREVGLRLSSYFQPPAQAAPGGGVDYLSNAMMSQVAMPSAPRGEGAERGGPNIPAEGQQEDLFLYTKKGVSLKKGESAVFDLLEVTVPYEDLYVWEIAPLPPREMWQHVGREQQQQLIRSMTGAKAMHHLRLTNSGDTPWTTGPATIFKGATPLGQQLLTYTSVKNKVDVPITIATDLNTKKEDTETARKHDALVISTTHYTQVTLHGKLTVTSFKDKAVRLIVKRKLVGTASDVSHDGKVRQANTIEDIAPELEGYAWYWWSWPWWYISVNPFSEITWELDLAKGKDVTLEYNCSYYCAR